MKKKQNRKTTFQVADDNHDSQFGSDKSISSSTNNKNKLLITTQQTSTLINESGRQTRYKSSSIKSRREKKMP